MRFIAAILLVLLLPTPARATNELAGKSMSLVKELCEHHGAELEQLSERDTALLDANTGQRPQPSTVYTITIHGRTVILLERDGDVFFSSDPIPVEQFNKMIGRVNA